ncbi:hypothetical protein C3943_08800 [Lysinibacillus sp. B2A1]|nr:hypothetical protein C3943_08800 [Lysinibacillus sp. B2A1]
MHALVGYQDGWKRSKFGEGHTFGPDQVPFLTKAKTISEKWLEQDNESLPSTFQVIIAKAGRKLFCLRPVWHKKTEEPKGHQFFNFATTFCF